MAKTPPHSSSRTVVVCRQYLLKGYGNASFSITREMTIDDLIDAMCAAAHIPPMRIGHDRRQTVMRRPMAAESLGQELRRQTETNKAAREPVESLRRELNHLKQAKEKVEREAAKALRPELRRLRQTKENTVQEAIESLGQELHSLSEAKRRAVQEVAEPLRQELNRLREANEEAKRNETERVQLEQARAEISLEAPEDWISMSRFIEHVAHLASEPQHLLTLRSCIENYIRDPENRRKNLFRYTRRPHGQNTYYINPEAFAFVLEGCGWVTPLPAKEPKWIASHDMAFNIYGSRDENYVDRVNRLAARLIRANKRINIGTAENPQWKSPQEILGLYKTHRATYYWNPDAINYVANRLGVVKELPTNSDFIDEASLLKGTGLRYRTGIKAIRSILNDLHMQETLPLRNAQGKTVHVEPGAAILEIRRGNRSVNHIDPRAVALYLLPDMILKRAEKQRLEAQETNPDKPPPLPPGDWLHSTRIANKLSLFPTDVAGAVIREFLKWHSQSENMEGIIHAASGSGPGGAGYFALRSIVGPARTISRDVLFAFRERLIEEGRDIPEIYFVSATSRKRRDDRDEDPLLSR